MKVEDSLLYGIYDTDLIEKLFKESEERKMSEIDNGSYEDYINYDVECETDGCENCPYAENNGENCRSQCMEIEEHTLVY